MKTLKIPLQFTAKVKKGFKQGRKISVPTANLQTNNSLTFKPGVYFAIVKLNQPTHLGLAYFGPNYLQKGVSCFEIHLFNFNRNIYQRSVKVTLTHFLRPPQKINNLQQLKSLIAKDFGNLNDYIIRVNKQDQPLGIINKRLAHLKPAQLHRAASVLVFNHKHQLLIQQRSRSKLLWPLYWSNTACTDLRPYESYLAAAQRCLQKELGLKTPLKLHHHFSYQRSYLSVGNEAEIDHVFIGTTNKTPQPDPQEISQFKYLSLHKLNALVKNRPQDYTPWFKLILKKL